MSGNDEDGYRGEDDDEDNHPGQNDIVARNRLLRRTVVILVRGQTEAHVTGAVQLADQVVGPTRPSADRPFSCWNCVQTLWLCEP